MGLAKVLFVWVDLHMRSNSLTYLSASVLPSSSANSVHVMKMANAFSNADFNVRLIGLRAKGARVTDGELRKYYNVSDRFSVHRVSQDGVFGYRARYAMEMLLGRWLSRGDILYTRIPKVAAMATITGHRCVLELHQPPRGTDLSAVRRHLTARTGGMIVVITETLRAWVLETLSADRTAVIVAPDGADPVDPSVAPALPASDKPRVGYLGQLYPGKGMELIERLIPRLPDVEFIVVGGMPKDVEFWRSRVAGLSNVRFIGHVPHSETSSWLKTFDLALMPNQNKITVSVDSTDISRWTSPLKAFEYMSARCPIVASDQENIREILTDGETAILCAPDDVESWVEAIRKLLRSDDFRNGIASSAETQFFRNFTWAARAEHLAAYLDP